MPRVLGWLVIAVGAACVMVALVQPDVVALLFVGGAVLIVVGVLIAFGAFEALPDEQGGTVEEWRARHWNREA